MSTSRVLEPAVGGAVDGELLARVRNRLVGSGSALTSSAVASAVREESGGLVADADVLAALRLVQQEFRGAGVLEPLLHDPEVCDVLVTAPNKVWVDRGNGLQRAAVRFADEDAVRRLAQRLAMSTGRRLDDAQPWVDAWLPQESTSGAVRLHAVLPPVAGEGTCISLRILRPAAHDLAALQQSGAFDGPTAQVLREVVAARLAFLVVGGTASGKTTLLAAMLGEVAETERIVCVEEAAELHPSHPHVVRLLTRPPNVEGVGEIQVRDLVRQALRMRPDRLIVGEVRGGEVRELLAALNTGHDGGGGTLHANSPQEVPARMEALAALGGLSRTALHSQLAAAVQVVLHVRRSAQRGRYLAGIGVMRRDGERVQVVPAWQRDGGWASGRADLAALLSARGGALPC
ncbi:TadA family conjugal transfer-associated ATPase [Saccharopolyspora sp. WRP15-2]|uniref:TadA family conjugal transfer-associated ATPase n=1 Tax=Saccharopolyspora oryzae TaxID=2997343 RepID=A0ABT4UUW4_9PSEU|nr:TadA family conjugal transfer-associated ATPase [Saccharopolyspora oryzae]MDA3624842.1 TadA family conjugal transfer-associated ATPase [Saccharopolyspora oryzae]